MFHIQPRRRNVRVLATLGPASRGPEMIEKLILAGADAFRVNMSHGVHADHARAIADIRAVEKTLRRPMTILADLQGPKLRCGLFTGGSTVLETGQDFIFDQDEGLGDSGRVCLPHPEIFAGLAPGARILLDDGKLRLRVKEATARRIVAGVEVGGTLSDHKGVNVPDAVIPLAALTGKDRTDLAFALDQNVDWVALSFVQRPEDVIEARELIGDRAALMAKIEKPAALHCLSEILSCVDALMVARGDMGVELPPQEVPAAQKRIVREARMAGRGVVVATQMLESMIQAPTPTRAEVSDVANAIYDGADAVMLSAESAAGRYPVEAVSMMDAIACEVERDPAYYRRIHFTQTPPEATTADALSAAVRQIARTLDLKTIVCFTTSGSTARRVSRERVGVPLLVLTPNLDTARRLGLVWGAHPLHTRDVSDFEEMVAKAKRMALRVGAASGGDRIAIIAGVPFGTPGSTNVLHVVRLTGDEVSDSTGTLDALGSDSADS